jgi:hypothetical protein
MIWILMAALILFLVFKPDQEKAKREMIEAARELFEWKSRGD